MKIYLVGGAVRDRLLGLPIKEKDYVVVGASVEEMLKLGYQPVGKAFPVFLHPKTKAEYALARTEKKVDKGYHGFTFHADPSVSLEEDLIRRDLTINAIAQDESTGKLIDPYNGQADLKEKWLRHVSDAFIEDPVRILRLARFAARFDPLGFRVHPDTLLLMKNMVNNGEVDALVPERVWREMQTALSEPSPCVFFEVLRECGALNVLFPEVNALFGIRQNINSHPEVDAGIHTLMVLTRAAELTDDPIIRFAALLHDLGKAQTPPEQLPSHKGHDERSAVLVKQLCARLHVPAEYEHMAVLVAAYHDLCHHALSLNADQLLTLLENLDAFRRPARLAPFLLACQADSQGRLGFENHPYPQSSFMQKILSIASSVNAAQIAAAAPPQGIKEAIRSARVAAIEQYKASLIGPFASA